MSRKLTKAQAEALWDSLRDAFANVEARIIEVIETRAWIPLGYATFPEAWNDRMKGFRLATEGLKAHVVYAMFADGQSDEEIITALGGQVGDQAVARLREQRVMGVPAGVATTRVRSHDRALPGEAEKLHVTLTHGEITYYKDLCDALGLDRNDEAATAIRAHFRRLERANRARSA